MPATRDLSFARSDGSSGAALTSTSPLDQDGYLKDAFGVVIGINSYLDHRIRDLSYAGADAQAFRDVLVDRDVGRIRPENVRLLLNEQATERAIRAALSTWLPSRITEDGLAFIYFAGHGVPVPDPRSTGSGVRISADRTEKFLVPHDADADDIRSSAISMEVVEKWFSYLQSRRVLFFLDCCYSGAARGERSFRLPGIGYRATTLSNDFVDHLASDKGRVVVTACDADEIALESEELGHGVFTHFLVKGLKGDADRLNQGIVSVDTLSAYLNEEVPRLARKLGGRMTPVKRGEMSGSVQLVEYVTPATRRAAQLAEQGQADRAKGNLVEAERLFREALALDPRQKVATLGLADLDRIRREKQARADAALDSLYELWRTRKLSAKEYDRAVTLLRSDRSLLTGADLEIRLLLDDLLASTLSIDNYLLSLGRVLRRFGMSRSMPPPLPAQPAPVAAVPALESALSLPPVELLGQRKKLRTWVVLAILFVPVVVLMVVPIWPSSPGPGVKPPPTNTENTGDTIAASHILIPYAGALRASPTLLDTKEQALRRAQDILDRANAGTDFAKLADENSSDPEVKSTHGALGKLHSTDRRMPVVDAAFKLKLNESSLIDTPFGFDVVKRTE